MYCSNCGNSIDPNAAVCVRCGFKTGNGVGFCANCGQPATPGASICIHCGCMLPGFIAQNTKSKIAAGLLGILLGAFGVHNFYLGFTGKAIAQLLLTLLTCGVGATISSVWGLIEGVMILTGSISTDANGIPLKD